MLFNRVSFWPLVAEFLPTPLHQAYVELITREPTGNNGDQVDVEVFAFFRDFSGQADDLWEAFARVTVIAETV